MLDRLSNKKIISYIFVCACMRQKNKKFNYFIGVAKKNKATTTCSSGGVACFILNQNIPV